MSSPKKKNPKSRTNREGSTESLTETSENNESTTAVGTLASPSKGTKSMPKEDQPSRESPTKSAKAAQVDHDASKGNEAASPSDQARSPSPAATTQDNTSPLKRKREQPAASTRETTESVIEIPSEDEASSPSSQLEAPETADDPVDDAPPPKRGRGRPPGSGKKGKKAQKTPIERSDDNGESSAAPPLKRGRGRPRGSGKKAKATEVERPDENEEDGTAPPTKKRRSLRESKNAAQTKIAQQAAARKTAAKAGKASTNDKIVAAPRGGSGDISRGSPPSPQTEYIVKQISKVIQDEFAKLREETQKFLQETIQPGTLKSKQGSLRGGS